MSSIKIITNNQKRHIIYGFEMPKGQRKNFDYLSNGEYIDRAFVQYLGHYYDISEFISVNTNNDLKDWDAYSADTYFSGVVIKLCDDDDSVIMGRYYS